MPYPVYAFTGFLESGKTKFIQETLCDPRFNAGERTLLLVCEEGEEEYDPQPYPHKDVFLEVIDQEQITTAELEALFRKHQAERVVVELNGMLQIGPFYQKMPESWQLAQEVMFADATTIMAYNANMRSLVVDKLTGCEMVVFNRMPVGADVMPFHKLARALNRRVGIMYEYADGKTRRRRLRALVPRYERGAKEIPRQDRALQGAGRASAQGARRLLRAGALRHDLLRRGYPVYGASLPL